MVPTPNRISRNVFPCGASADFFLPIHIGICLLFLQMVFVQKKPQNFGRLRNFPLRFLLCNHLSIDTYRTIFASFFPKYRSEFPDSRGLVYPMGESDPNHCAGFFWQSGNSQLLGNVELRRTYNLCWDAAAYSSHFHDS